MKPLPIRSLRPFIGARDFTISCRFYREIGFEEIPVDPGFHLFQSGIIAFYLQDAFVKDWIDNSMLFAEVDNADTLWEQISALELERKFPGVRIKPIIQRPWGREFFLHDPSGILWHFGDFSS